MSSLLEFVPLTELIGYLASAVVLISLTLRSIVRLRLVNLLGAVIFTVYGLLIGSMPVAVMNAAIAAVNVYHLSRMREQKSYFDLLPVAADDAFLRFFLNKYKDDIAQFAPHFRSRLPDDVLALLVIHDNEAAGVLIGLQEGKTLVVELDYVLPTYRDFAVGRYIYHENASYLHALGVNRVVVPHPERQMEYWQKMGFVEQDRLLSLTI